jgi:hypothetical protein
MPGFNDIGLKEVVATTSWYIWWVRHRRTCNEDVAPIFKRKMSTLAIASNSAKTMTLSRPTSEDRWSRPLPRQVKVNVDASFFEDSQSGAVGAVLWDYQGQFIAASCKFFPHLTSAMMVEAMAMKEV